MTDLERVERYRWEAVLREGYRLADAKRAMVQAALRLAQAMCSSYPFVDRLLDECADGRASA